MVMMTTATHLGNSHHRFLCMPAASAIAGLDVSGVLVSVVRCRLALDLNLHNPPLLGTFGTGIG